MKGVEKIIVKKIIESLEAGTPAWVSPYRKQGVPRNGGSGWEYNGINKLFLSHRNYPSNKYYTFNQIMRNGWAMEKGSKGEFIVAYMSGKRTVEDADGEEREKSFFTLRYYTVFNESLLTHYEKDSVEILEPLPVPFLSHLKDYINVSSAVVPNYQPDTHTVQMPNEREFASKDEYLSTLFHELVHWTMKPLDRKLPYQEEELVAEMGAGFLCQEYGVLQSIDNLTAYCNGWLKHCTEKKETILRAAQLANKAVKYLKELGGENEL